MGNSRISWVVCDCYFIYCKVVYGLEWGCIFVVVDDTAAIFFYFIVRLGNTDQEKIQKLEIHLYWLLHFSNFQ